MRILHVVHQYPPAFVGGTELYTQNIAQAQAALGHDVTVVYRDWDTDQGKVIWNDNGVKVWKIWDGPFSASRRLLATFRAPYIDQAFGEILDAAKPDVLHLQHLMGLPTTIGQHWQPHAPPILATLHDYWWFCANAQLVTNDRQNICGGPRAYFNCARCALARANLPTWPPLQPPMAGIMAYRAHALRRLVSSVDLWIAPTAFVRDIYLQHGFPVDRVKVIPHGWLSKLESGQRLADQKHPTLRFAYVGGLSWQKGLHVLVDAFNSVQGKAELWIVGKAPDSRYSHQLKRMAGANIKFLGELPHEQVANVLNKVDAVVVPSLWYETFSLLVSEAFAAGKPVIASDIGGLGNRVRDGVDGLLVAPGDVRAWQAALQHLVNQPGQLEELRKNVRPPITLAEHITAIELAYNRLLVL